MIKLIATDMDGTLLNDEKKVSKENVTAIKLAQQKGIEVVVATGRSKKEALEPLQEAGLSCPIISINGAQTWDNQSKLQTTNALDLSVAKWAIQILREHSIYFELYLQSGTYSDNKKQALDVIVDLFETTGALSTQQEIKKMANYRIANGSITFVDQYESLLNEKDPALKLLAFSTNLILLDQIEETLAEHSELSVTASARGNLEINAISAQKGIAVQAFAQQAGISMDSVMALGDNLNDVSMMKVAGYPVAMDNAAYELKQLCKYKTLSHDQHGVAEAIYTYTDIERPL
ncbi:Cof-type HAD-IIB family hydrolase [Alkalicoccobacillus murimartini]|uniref:Cof subfamily protein (Haloacid dehalogenase superfamily) n=1 Tax=Alkalicoccobacillus murimartini TaxID=171685 RepID=A0ABT9YEE4_9BACI|nr:Cof-type HAD-IIB family hydrolase [Alkalicoccobacillus murimartini]MDQ0205993.1 Cof subfamily protein (haloacid dehalogenase superfamily) [Alkalicoccobacillus murimartini]